MIPGMNFPAAERRGSKPEVIKPASRRRKGNRMPGYENV